MAVIAPAGDGAVPLHPAGVAFPGADGDELPGRRRGLAPTVIAPAGDGAVPLHPAGVEPPGADGDELPGRRRGLALPVKAPAGAGAVPLHHTGGFALTIPALGLLQLAPQP